MPVTVRIHDPECALQVIIILQYLAIDSGRHELLKVYDAIIIIVTLLYNLVPVDVVVTHDLLMYHLLKFPLGQRTIPILVNTNELLLQFV
jgi:hypothetical protein